jgi:hypothetical protein
MFQMLVDFAEKQWLDCGQQRQCTSRAQASTQQEAKWYRSLRTGQRAKARKQTNGLVKIQVSTLTSRYYLEFAVVAQQEVNALTMHLSTESQDIGQVLQIDVVKNYADNLVSKASQL